MVPGGCEGRCEGSTHPFRHRGVAVSPRLPLAGLTQPGSARSGRMEGGGQSLEGCSFAVPRCFINHRPALGWGGPSVCPSTSVCHTAKDAEERGEESAEPVGALLSGKASEPPGKDGIAPGGKGCWQIQPCVEYYGPKWERLVIRKLLHAGLSAGYRNVIIRCLETGSDSMNLRKQVDSLLWTAKIYSYQGITECFGWKGCQSSSRSSPILPQGRDTFL